MNNVRPFCSPAPCSILLCAVIMRLDSIKQLDITIHSSSRCRNQGNWQHQEVAHLRAFYSELRPSLAYRKEDEEVATSTPQLEILQDLLVASFLQALKAVGKSNLGILLKATSVPRYMFLHALFLADSTGEIHWSY